MREVQKIPWTLCLLLQFDSGTCERWRIRTGASAEGFAILEIGHIAADQVYF